MSDNSDTKIHSITISDHTPVSITLKNNRVIPLARNWRFNTSLLKDPDFINYFKREWYVYLENNDLPGMSACILWEAVKAVMRGKIISFSSNKKKRENSRISDSGLNL